MAVRFVIGRAGSGKTHHCLTSICELLREDALGPTVIWLTPRQATFLAERDLTIASGGFVRARVLSFEQLCEQVLCECGGAAIPEISPLGRGMILGHLLRVAEPSLVFFSKVARHPSLASRIDATLEELEAAGKGPADLEALLKNIQANVRPGDDADPLHAKLHDLCLIYRSYCEFVGQDRLDPRRRMQRVLECMSKSKLLRGATVFVDAFTEFDDVQRRLLAKLAGVCARLEITLLMDGQSPLLDDARQVPREMGLFHRLEQTYRRLMTALVEQGVEIQRPLVLRDAPRFENDVLREIERAAFSSTCPIQDPGARVSFLEAPDRRAEVDAAARHIRHLTANGMRFRDVAIIVRDLEDYNDLISASFREHEIPYFVDRRRTMAHHPLFALLRGVMAAALHNWSHDGMMQVLKTGLAGLTGPDADALENYVLEHHLRGAVWARAEPWAWTRHPARGDDESIEQAEEAQNANLLRQRLVTPIVQFLSLFPDAKVRRPLREIVTGILGLLGGFQVPATIAQWIDQSRAASDHEQAGEHEQVWTELLGLFDQMTQLLAEQAMGLADFNQVLEAGLESFDLALAPPTVDQVLVGQVDRTRTPVLQAALVLGLSEGSFPHAPRPNSILSDPDRDELERQSFEVDPGSQRRALDEELLGYIAFTRASQSLWLSRFISDEKGRAAGPSPFWINLRQVLPEHPVHSLPRDERDDASLISTPRQLLTTLMRWARSGTDPEADPSLPALYHWLSTHPTRGDALDTLRFRAWKALHYDNSAALSPAVAQRLFSSPLNAPVHQIETFATCGFRHFLRHGLALHQREEEEYIAINLEYAFHDVMDRLVREMLRRRANWASLGPDQVRELVQSYARQIAGTLRGEMMLSNARNQYLLGRIEQALEQVIQTQQAISARGDFEAALCGVRFGTDGAMLPALQIQTPKGRQIQLAGRIDRVDILHGKDAFTVLDYRLKGGELHLGRAAVGLNLSLLVGLLVVQEHGAQIAGRKIAPAAAFYMRLLRQLESVEHPSEGLEKDDPRFPLRGAKLRGLFDAAFFDELDDQCLPKSSSDVLAARRNADGSLGHKATTDFAEGDEFAAFLRMIQRRIGELADQVLDGQIDIRPYRIKTAVPCSSCGYRSACRFDPALNRYNVLTIKKREEVLNDALEAKHA